jgi:hypothetical protein
MVGREINILESELQTFVETKPAPYNRVATSFAAPSIAPMIARTLRGLTQPEGVLVFWRAQPDLPTQELLEHVLVQESSLGTREVVACMAPP